MSISLEYKKAKRTGFLPAFFGGGILAAAVPLVNMAARSKLYLTQQGSPMQILMGANWQMMAMLNVLLVVAGACLLYDTEYANHAIQKMQTLPIQESSIFFGKAILMSLMSMLTLAMEAAAISFCAAHWFAIESGFCAELLKNFAYSLFLLLPCIVLSLLIAGACKNMWVSLGIGVVCVFTATMLPSHSFFLSCFPFALPFQIFAGTMQSQAMHYIYAAAIELAVISLAELVFLNVRRSLE